MSASSPISRRQAIRLITAAALASIPSARLMADADAARGWCRADPLLRIGGQYVHVYITSSTSMLRSATDKIRLRVALPYGVSGRLADVLADFGEGYDVRFVTSSALHVVDGKIPVAVSVYCPARDSTLPVFVDFTPVNTGPLVPGYATGTANSVISLLAS